MNGSNLENYSSRNKKIIIGLFIVIIIIIAGVIGTILQDSFINNIDEILESNPQADRMIARIGDSINFSAEESKGNIVKYHWDFDDGNNSREKNPSHSYDNSNWYNVSLIVENENGKTTDSILVIGIQHNDENPITGAPLVRDLRPLTSYTFYNYAHVGPNIDQPTIEIQSEINNVIGDLEFIIDLAYYLPEGNGISLTIYTESTFASNEDIQFNNTIQSEDLPIEMQMYDSDIHAYIVLYNGRWESAIIDINVIFPVENVTVPSSSIEYDFLNTSHCNP